MNLLRSGRVEEQAGAEKEFEKAVRIDPDFAAAWVALGFARERKLAGGAGVRGLSESDCRGQQAGRASHRTGARGFTTSAMAGGSSIPGSGVAAQSD